MDNKQLIKTFTERLELMHVDAALKEKYLKEYKHLLSMRNDPHHKVEQCLPQIKFACFCRNTQRISSELKLMKALAAGNNVELRVFTNLGATDNLLGRLNDSNVETPKLKPLTKIRVWQEAAPHELPNLTLREIVTQIPYCLVSKVEAVCLLSEDDNIARDSYNVLMDAYEYSIWLFSK